VLLSLCEGARATSDAIAAGDVTVDGDPTAANEIFDHLDTFMSMFKLVEP
jgi:alkyl sulfatase BDS1-like metallo-beta-lactamase superfamily hydrolase